MNVADADPPRAEPTVRRSAPAPEAVAEHATPRGCPFLLAEAGGWRLDVPSREHRCGAFVPAAPLAPEKQSRLCLTAEHASCATYLASVAARTARVGAPSGDRATRWGLARTTTVIEDPGGVRALLLGAALDRRRWPAIPAFLLVATLFTLALTGFRGEAPSSAVGSPSPGAPTPPPTTAATPAIQTVGPTPGVTPATSSAPTTAPTVAPTPGPSPQATFRTYRVRAGDTLSAIAARFDTTVSAIVNLNDLNNANELNVGQVLRIPN